MERMTKNCGNCGNCKVDLDLDSMKVSRFCKIKDSTVTLSHSCNFHCAKSVTVSADVVGYVDHLYGSIV